MTLTVITATGVGETGTWCTTGRDALVQLPAHHVTSHGAAAVQAAWRAYLAAGGVHRAGPDPRITYDRSRAATRTVRMTVVPGRIVGTLGWGHFTARGAAAVQAIAWAMQQDATAVVAV